MGRGDFQKEELGSVKDDIALTGKHVSARNKYTSCNSDLSIEKSASDNVV